MPFTNRRIPAGLSLTKSEYGIRYPWDPLIAEEDIQQQPIHQFSLPPPPMTAEQAKYRQSPLFTVPVKLMNAVRPYEAIAVNGMIDSGCNRTCISLQLAKDLGVLSTPKDITIIGVHGPRKTSGGYGAYIGVQPLHPVFGAQQDPILLLSFQILEPFPPIMAEDFSWLSGEFRLNIPPPVNYRGSKQIQIILGQDLRKYCRPTHTRISGPYSLEVCALGYQITREPSGSMYHHERLFQAAAYAYCGQLVQAEDDDPCCLVGAPPGAACEAVNVEGVRRRRQLRRQAKKLKKERAKANRHPEQLFQTTKANYGKSRNASKRYQINAKRDLRNYISYKQHSEEASVAIPGVEDAPSEDDTVPGVDDPPNEPDIDQELTSEERCESGFFLINSIGEVPSFTKEMFEEQSPDDSKESVLTEESVPGEATCLTGSTKQADILREVRDLLAQHWRLNEPPRLENGPNTVEENRCIKLLNDSFAIRDGHIYVSPLWKEGQPEEGLNNFHYAKKRLEGTVKKLLSDGTRQHFDEYHAVFQSYLEQGFAEDITDKVKDYYEEDGLYWPHFPVYKPESESTKVRPVMDGAAKCLDGQSINEKCFSKGPCMMADLVRVFTRFRRYDIAFTGDIYKMFLSIKIPPEYRKYYRFIWVDPEDPKNLDKIRIYQFTGHLFGCNSSPTCSVHSHEKNAKQYEAEMPRAVEVIMESTLMDDCLDSEPTEEGVLAILNDLSKIHKPVGLKITKIVTNSAKVADNLPEGCEASVTMKELSLSDHSGSTNPNDREYALGTEPKQPQIRTLGQKWCPEGDYFTYGTYEIDPERVWSKVTCLSQAHTIFDPIGFLIPILLEAKLLLQELWKKELEWKTPIESDDLERWNKWLTALPRLQEIKVPRVLIPGNPDDIVSKQIHVCTDASAVSYAAVAYLRVVYNNGETRSLIIQAKGKIKPINIARTIPVLELMGIELGCRLAATVIVPLGMDISDVRLWSDSKTALQWLRMEPGHLRVLCHNYCQKIKATLSRDQINWIPGTENSADLATRPLTFQEFYDNQDKWIFGPKFLRENEDSWPSLPELEKTPDVLTQVKREHKLFEEFPAATAIYDVIALRDSRPRFSRSKPRETKKRKKEDNDPLHPRNFSSYTKMKRTFAWVLRFLSGAKTTPVNGSIHLTPEDLDKAEIYMVALMQKRCFNREIALIKSNSLESTHALYKCGAELDRLYGQDVIRLGGRVKHASHLSDRTKRPFLLHPDDPLTKLLVLHYHEGRLLHSGGIKCLLSELQRSFFVIGNISALKKIVSTCVECRKANPKPIRQAEAPLPEDRIPGDVRVAPFSVLGWDAAGPWRTIQGRGQARKKRWALIFRCTLTGAIHIEMLTGMSELHCLMALQRFTSLYCVPEKVYSDNGTNFVALATTLHEAWRRTDKDFPPKFFFTPPEAPNFNGLTEIYVKQAKKALAPILKDSEINDESLHTYFYMISHLLNDRPLLWHGNPDAKDFEHLTPNHFLMKGRLGTTLALPGSSPRNPLNHYIHLQKLADRFYRRLSTLILPRLRQLDWRLRPQGQLREGDVVVVLHEENSKIQSRFPLGRVVKTYPGQDGISRRFTVQMADGRQLQRAGNRLSLVLPEAEASLPPLEEEDTPSRNLRSRKAHNNVNTLFFMQFEGKVTKNRRINPSATA